MPGIINYAQDYSQALMQEFSQGALYFSELWTSPNAALARYLAADTVHIPHIETSGRVDGDRDTIGTGKRRHSNTWIPKKLRNHRTWDTLIHPMDVRQTGAVVAITNATQVFNQEQKLPEMDAYAVSAVYADLKNAAITTGKTAKISNTVLTADNILDILDAENSKMDDNGVPSTGRILYCTSEVRDLIKHAKEVQRIFNTQSGQAVIDRRVTRVDDLTIKPVPSNLMKTVYNFTEGFEPGVSAKQINYFMVHTSAILPCINYESAYLQEPSAVTQGKYYYFEESFEDMFVMDYKMDAIAFNVEA